MKLTRRKFIETSSLFLSSLGCTGISSTQAKETPSLPLFRIGVLTDLHYATKDPAGTRHYRETLQKATEAVELFREQAVDFIVELGDVIDAAASVEVERSYLSTIWKVLSKAERPIHHVLGNHCVATLTKEEFLQTIGAAKSYYSFDHKNHHFIVLDACYTGEGIPYGRNNFDWTDANVTDEQLKWLEADLAKSCSPSIILAHQRLDLEPKNAHAVKQCLEIRRILEESGRVAAVFQGHSHQNVLNHIQGIPYCTLRAMVEGAGEENSGYAVLEVHPNGMLQLKGFRKQDSWEAPKPV